MKHCISCNEEIAFCEGEPICGLKYIARSPAQEHGGFAPQAVATAKAALRLIYELRRKCAHQDKYFATVALQYLDAKEKLEELGVNT